jgi:hypothetical protein
MFGKLNKSNRPNVAPGAWLTRGLQLYFTMDAADRIGDSLADKSGNGNTGTIHGATAMVGINGGANTALNFVNTSSQYILLGADTNLGVSSITASVWIAPSKPVELNNNYFICGKYDYTPKNGWMFSLSGYQPTPGLHVSMGDGTNRQELNVNQAILSDGTWQHFVFTHSAGKTVVYYQGSPILTDNSSPIGSLSVAAQNCSIAEAAGGGFFAGGIDQLRVYNWVMSPAQIQTIYLGKY